MSEEEEFFVPSLSQDRLAFPDPRSAADDAPLAYGGDLSSARLLLAYQQGIFPWYSQDDPILWWSPNPRLLLFPSDFKVRKSFARVLRAGKFSVRFDTCFKEVISRCASVNREGQESSWIIQEIEEAYTALHEEGYAHSVEVFLEDTLVGGLYGVSLGKAFFGESMFSLVSDASKVAFKAFSDVLGAKGYDFIDCQMRTEHMVRLGAREVKRDFFLDALALTLEKPTAHGSWQEFEWKYIENEGKKDAK